MSQHFAGSDSVVGDTGNNKGFRLLRPASCDILGFGGLGFSVVF